MELNYMVLGRRIKHARRAKRITQATLSEMIETSSSYVSYIENGRKTLSLGTLVQIANALEVTADELLEGNLVAETKPAEVEFSSLISDCSSYERCIILDTLKALKASLRENQHLDNI